MTAVARITRAVAVALAAAAAPAYSQNPTPVLDVPYVLQSEELCGGAAVAMVMRFWGATGIYAESFSSLVDRNARGIRGEDLIRTLRERGWQAASFSGDPQLIQASLQQRRPPIALIEVRPGRFHYVVILSWAAGRVLVHDPARKPFAVHDEAEFMKAWSRSDRWTLVALPGTPVAAPPPSATPADAPAVSTAGRCGPSVDEAVRLANRGNLASARGLLEGATAQCPNEPAGWRELAGLDALNKDWQKAAANARRALSVSGADEHAARILATSLFLEGDTIGALRAWNRAGEPTVDLVEVRGLERTRFAVPIDAMRLQPQTRLTAARLTRAARRLDALPAFMGSRLAYTPKDNGLAQVTAAVIERPVFPTSTFAVAATGLRLATDRELRVNVASLTGGGELWHASWRWWAARPRTSLGLDAPAPFGGVWTVAAVSERETYGTVGTFQQQRRTLALSLADWATGTTRWTVGLTREGWPAGAATGLLAGVRYQTLDHRLAADVHATAWDAARRAWQSSAGVEWRSRTRHEGTVVSARAAASLASAGTPLMLWSGAGSGQGRDELLRAHPLLHDGVIRDAVFGRGLINGSVEWRRWRPPFKRVLRIAPALFVDAARAYHVPEFGDRRVHVDGGGGVRLSIPGAGIVRADLAAGLRDGNLALTFGWGK